MLDTSERSLRTYYLTRFAVSAAWVAAALSIGRESAPAAAVLLVAYPAWDALANAADAVRSGGLARNPSQTLNLIVSATTALAVAIALGRGPHAVLGVFAIWAALAGLFQLLTGVRRWRSHGAQWVMILSGAQSALAATHMAKQALDVPVPGIADIAPYAGFGAFYFLLSAIWLIARERRGRTRSAAA